MAPPDKVNLINRNVGGCPLHTEIIRRASDIDQNFISKMKVILIASLAIQLLCVGLVQGQERVR